MTKEQKQELANDIRGLVNALNVKMKALDGSKLRINIIQEKAPALYVNGTVKVSITDTTQI